MTDATERFLTAMRNGGWKVKQAGRDRWTGQCPAHSGEDLNLSIAKGDQGVLIRDWSHSCAEGDIARAVGLELRDLFDKDGRAQYDYGNGYVIERRRTDAGKTVKPVRSGITPDVRPLWSPAGSRPIAESNVVMLCEGEKTADALVRLGARCVATWAGGTSGVDKADYGPLAGRTVVIVPDNDEPGQKALRTLSGLLAPIAAEVKVWRVPSHLNDAADLWLAGGALDDLTCDADQFEPAREAGSWEPVDVAAVVTGIVTGTTTRTIPEVLTRDDGSALLYAGKVNGIHGDSGSGKTWTALYASAETILAGGDVVYVDLEDSPADVVTRLLALSVPPADVVKHFRYVQPETAFADGAEGFLRVAAAARLVVIDSTGESLSIEGLNPNADEDIAAWFRSVPKRIAKLGPAVLVLDHMPKSSDSDLWPIGSQRKRAAIDGAQYLQEVLVPFSRGKAGAARLVCAKDRHGTYARAQRVAVLQVTPDNGTVRLGLHVPEGAPAGSGSFEPTALMEKVSRALEGAAGACTYRGILERVEGKKEYIRRAVDALIASGHVTTSPGPRNSIEHTSARPYRDGAHSTAEMTPEASVTVPVPKGGERGTVTLTVPGEQWGTVGEQSMRGGSDHAI